jgi:hypothetical protein
VENKTCVFGSNSIQEADIVSNAWRGDISQRVSFSEDHDEDDQGEQV